MSLKLSKSLFFFLFIFSPLAFGTTEPWSYAIMESITALSLLFLFFWAIKANQSLYQVPGIIPLLLFLAYILFQLVPLPSFIIEFISPNAFKIHQTNQFITGTQSWMALTVHPKATLSEFFRYSTYVMFYVLTIQLLCSKRTLQATVLTIAIFGGILAFSSILQFYLTEDMALWFRHAPINSIVVGPYVNHNHYAGLMEMIFPIVLGLFLFYRPRIGNTSLLKGIAEIFSQEKANIHILIGTSALLIVISIFVSLSRGAMISTCLALTLFTFLLLKRKISKGNTILIIVIIMISTLSIGWFGWDQIFERFARLKKAQGVVYEARLDFWKDSKEIIRNFPVTGSGMGTFSHIYPLHRSYTSKRVLRHAHNDYLELLVEGGMIAFVLAAGFLIIFFVKTYKVFLKRRDAFSIYLYMGSLTAMVSILFHSFTDFNMHIGANGLWFFFTAGIAVSAANTGIRKQSLETRLLPVASKGLKSGLGLLVFVLALSTIAFNTSNMLGRFYYSNIKNYILRAKTPPHLLEKIEKVAVFSARLDPLHSEYPFTTANTAWFLNNIELSKQYFITSLKLDPLNSRHLNRFARFLARQKQHDQAEIAFQKSMVYDRISAEYAFEYATWLFSQQKFDPGLVYIKKTLSLDTSLINRALTAMILSGIDQDKIKQAIPETPGPAIAFAQFLFDTGKTMESIERYIDTLDLIENQTFKTSEDNKQQEKIKVSQFFKIYYFFTKYNDFKNAMHVMERAEKNLPMNARIKVALGDLYYKQGITYKARDKYDHALILNPKNQHALKMIKKINH
ncbi:MAG: O-antigen ligase family protein [Pseudomonadota bacterium]